MTSRRGALAALAALAPLALAAAGGCASFDEIVRPARDAYFDGRYREAEEFLAPLIEDGGKDQPVFLLEQTLPLLAQGKIKESGDALRRVRDEFELYEKQDAAEWIAAVLKDDTAIAYAGEDYEKILIRVMLALADLLRSGADALAYANQIILKQNEIIEKSPEIEGTKLKANYKHLGIGRYLVGLLSEERYDYSTAERSYRQVAELEPAFAYAAEDLERARSGVHCGPGNGVLYVFALIDRGPGKIQVEDVPTTAAVHMVWIMGSILGQKLVTPSVVPVKVPGFEFPGRTIQAIDVLVEGQHARTTSEILDVQQAASRQFQELRDWIVARAFLRRILKKAVVETGKRAIQHQQRRNDDAQAATEVGAIVANAIWEAVEVADTRSWGTLPASLQVARIEIPAGAHTIELAPRVNGQPVCAPISCGVLIEDGRNAYCVAILPSSSAAPAVLVSRAPFEAPAGPPQPEAARVGPP